MSIPPARRPVSINTKYEPRGRNGLALIGMLLVIGGTAFGGYMAHANLSFLLPLNNASTTATLQPVQPSGTPLTNFVTYRDPQHRFALYYSKLWKPQNTSMKIDTLPRNMVTFTSEGTKLPQWSIGILPTNIGSAQLIDVTNEMLGSLGLTDFTPTDGPNVDPITIGINKWYQLKGTAVLDGQKIKLSTLCGKYGLGTVFIYQSELDVLYSGTEEQNFMPMIASIGLRSN
jgi:hypothetical protein